MLLAHKNRFQKSRNQFLLFILLLSLFAGLIPFTSFQSLFSDSNKSNFDNNSFSTLDHSTNDITSIDPVPNRLNSLDLYQVSIDIGISGKLSLGTQIWVGCRIEPSNGLPSSKRSLPFSNQEVLLVNYTINRRNEIPYSGLWKTWNIYDLGFSKDQVFPSPEKVWYLRIKNSMNASQKYYEQLTSNPYLENHTEPGSWLKEFRIRFGSEYAFRSLLHPYITYGTNTIVEITGRNDEFVYLRPSPSRRGWYSENNENDSNLLGAALIVGFSHYEYQNDLEFADDEASIMVEALFATGRYDIYYLIEGNAKYTIGTFPDIYITDNDIEEGLDILADETSAGDIAIVMFSGHGGPPDLDGNAAIYSMNTAKYFGNWEAVITQDEFKNKLQAINDVNDSVSIFCWLNFCEGQNFDYILEDNHISNAIFWWYDGVMYHGSKNMEAIRAFGTNLNYAFYSLEELYDTIATYASPPRWYIGNRNGSYSWPNSTVKPISSYQYGDHILQESDGYHPELFLNPHSAHFQAGSWEISPTGNLTTLSGDFMSEISNFPSKRYIKVWEYNDTANCSVGVKFIFNKEWDTDLEVQFNVRATSNYSGSDEITNFYTRIYDENGTYIDNSERCIYLSSSQDTGWTFKTFLWGNNLLPAGNKYQLVFYYKDIWSSNYFQTIYINSTITISESNVGYIFSATGFEEFTDFDDWTGVDAPKNTMFNRTSNLKKEGNYAGCQNSTSGLNYRRDRWETLGAHNGGSLEGWVYDSHSSQGGRVEIDILYIRKGYRYGFALHVDFFIMYAIIDYRIQEWYYPLNENHENSWWWFRMTLKNRAGANGEDILQLWWKKAGGSLHSSPPNKVALGNLGSGYVSLHSLIGGPYKETYFDELLFRSNHYKTGFEDTAEMDDWTAIEAPKNTSFNRSSTLKKEGNYAGCQKGNSSSIYRTDYWNAPGTHFGGILEGWLFDKRVNDSGKVEINVLWQNIYNRVGITFHLDYIAVFTIDNGRLKTWPISLRENYQNTWWWFRITFIYDGPVNMDNFELLWQKQGETINSFELKNVSMGTFDEGYVALRSKVSSSGETYYDDLKFRPYFYIPPRRRPSEEDLIPLFIILGIIGSALIIFVLVTVLTEWILNYPEDKVRDEFL